MKRKVLLLDIDYTVINTDSMIEFMIYSLKTKFLKTLMKIPYILIVLILYVFKIVSLRKAKEAIFYPIVDYNDYELEKFFKLSIENKINNNMKYIIKDAKEKGMYIIMVTASPYAYMKYFKKYGFTDEIIGTNLKYEEGKYKNELVGENCKGNEKVIRINKLLKEKSISIDYENSYAYSDSRSDMPMLALVENSYIVNKKDGTIVECIKNKRASSL